MQPRERKTLVRGLIPLPGIDQYLAQLFAQTNMARGAIDRALQRLYCPMHHAVLDQQLRIDDGALGVEVTRHVSYHRLSRQLSSLAQVAIDSQRTPRNALQTCSRPHRKQAFPSSLRSFTRRSRHNAYSRLVA